MSELRALCESIKFSPKSKVSVLLKAKPSDVTDEMLAKACLSTKAYSVNKDGLMNKVDSILSVRVITEQAETVKPAKKSTSKKEAEPPYWSR